MREYECYVCGRSGKDDTWESKSKLRLGSCQDCGLYYCVSTDDDDTKTGCFYSECHDLCGGGAPAYHLADPACPHWPAEIPVEERKDFHEALDRLVKAFIDKSEQEKNSAKNANPREHGSS